MYLLNERLVVLMILIGTRGHDKDFRPIFYFDFAMRSLLFFADPCLISNKEHVTIPTVLHLFIFVGSFKLHENTEEKD